MSTAIRSRHGLLKAKLLDDGLLFAVPVSQDPLNNPPKKPKEGLNNSFSA
jgi:hypothetical protein